MMFAEALFSHVRSALVIGVSLSAVPLFLLRRYGILLVLVNGSRLESIRLLGNEKATYARSNLLYQSGKRNTVRLRTIQFSLCSPFWRDIMLTVNKPHNNAPKDSAVSTDKAAKPTVILLSYTLRDSTS